MVDILQVEVGVLSHPGKKRANNEDFVTYFEPATPQDLLASGRLYIVADGVGGAAEGERASKFAAEQVKFLYYQNPQLPPGERLRWAMRQASQEIYRYAESDGSHRRMATTLVAAVILGDQLTVAHVGDSRAYLIRGGLAQQLTQDHTTVGEMVRSGLMSEAEAIRSNAKNRLTRSLGGDEDVSVEVVSGIPLQVGDRVLLCTDGLTRYTNRAEIARLATEGNAEEAALRMVDYANEQGGADNITVALVAVTGVEAAPTVIAAEARGAAPAPIDLELLETQARAERGLPPRKGRHKKTAPAPLLKNLPSQARVYAPLGVAIIALFFVGMVIGIGVILKPPPTPTENSAALFAAATATNAAKTATAQTAQTAQAILATTNAAITQTKETEIALQATQTALALIQAAQSQPTETPAPAEPPLLANTQIQYGCFGRINQETLANNILKDNANTTQPLNVYKCKPDDKPTEARKTGQCWFEKQLLEGWENYQQPGQWIRIPDIESEQACFDYSYTNSNGTLTLYGVWAEILSTPPSPTATPYPAGAREPPRQDGPPPGPIQPSESPESSGPEEPPPGSPEPPEPSEPPPPKPFEE
ncbi:MAG: protein phosphatase 2C domain-containing protein [Anaerolineales bacterium]|nr:protein phosphatase 2C domain-containing protein [Anaerolineales bacterium]